MIMVSAKAHLERWERGFGVSGEGEDMGNSEVAGVIVWSKMANKMEIE